MSSTSEPIPSKSELPVEVYLHDDTLPRHDPRFKKHPTKIRKKKRIDDEQKS